MKTLKLTALAFCVTLVGCAATVQKGNSTAPEASDGSKTTAPTTAAVKVNIPAASATRLVVNMSGSKISTESKDWPAFKEEWRAIFQQQATAAGIKFEWQEGALRPLGQPGTLLAVSVNDYRFVGQGARVMFGIMTGNAYIDAKLRFSDLKDGAVFGEQSYNTSSSAGHGIFAAVTPKQIYAIADEVIREMKSR
jgi:ABC-type uncharacterized transport system auxiliary subunit